MGHPELAPVSFISMVVVLMPLPWHLRVRNMATVSTFLWLAFLNLHHFVNALLWKGNVGIRAEVYCDICELASIFFGLGDCLV
jgi:pheromone a factor receptor